MTKVTVIDRTMAELSFGKRIKARREQLGTSGYRVSADAGVDSGLYAKIETGQRRPTDDVLAKLAPVLEVPVKQLRAWLVASEMDQEEKHYLWQDEASPLVRIEAANQEIRKLAEEKLAIARAATEGAGDGSIWMGAGGMQRETRAATPRARATSLQRMVSTSPPVGR